LQFACDFLRPRRRASPGCVLPAISYGQPDSRERISLLSVGSGACARAGKSKKRDAGDLPVDAHGRPWKIMAACLVSRAFMLAAGSSQNEQHRSERGCMRHAPCGRAPIACRDEWRVETCGEPDKSRLIICGLKLEAIREPIFRTTRNFLRRCRVLGGRRSSGRNHEPHS
jgi:hypothetical protein